MEKETVKQEATVVNEVEKTFTQAELDQIVQDRLKREREKYGDYNSLKEKAARLDEIEEASKTELQKATERAEKLQAELSAMKHADEIRTIRDKVAQATGVPVGLLSGETEDACTEQANAIPLRDYLTFQFYALSSKKSVMIMRGSQHSFRIDLDNLCQVHYTSKCCVRKAIKRYYGPAAV